MNFVCKIFRFVLDLFGNVVDFVAGAVTVIGTAIVDVLSDLIVAASEGIGSIFGSNPLLWGALLIGAAYFLLGGSDDDKDNGLKQEVQRGRDQLRQQVKNG